MTMIILYDPPPIISASIDDAEIPGVVVELDQDSAFAEGAFVEDALTDAEAWESNADLAVAGDGGEDGHG